MIDFVKKICLINWKKKAVIRAKEIRRLNKKILEIEESRDKWKNKAGILKGKVFDLENELKKNL